MSMGLTVCNVMSNIRLIVIILAAHFGISASLASEFRDLRTTLISVSHTARD